MFSVSVNVTNFDQHPIVDNYKLDSLKLVFSGAAPLGGEIEKALSARLKVPVSFNFLSLTCGFLFWRKFFEF
jgi:hypothetical protein